MHIVIENDGSLQQHGNTYQVLEAYKDPATVGPTTLSTRPAFSGGPNLS